MAARADHMPDPRPSLLTIPPEVRNQIYYLLFCPPICKPAPTATKPQSASLARFGKSSLYDDWHGTPTDKAALVRSCRQLHDETYLLYLNTTPFHLLGSVADAVAFAELTSHLSYRHRQAVRHIVLTARIPHLRALNETWNSLPFGHSELQLDTLTLVPKSPELHGSAFAEVANLSQGHTLAYILGETLKGLRNVDLVIVQNAGRFNGVVWRLVYRSLIFRLWKWCGKLCDLRFFEDEAGGFFEVRCSNSAFSVNADCKRHDGKAWSDLSQELARLVGAREDAMAIVDGL